MMLKKKTGLKGKQNKLDMDKDGKITGKDFKMLKRKKFLMSKQKRD